MALASMTSVKIFVLHRPDFACNWISDFVNCSITSPIFYKGIQRGKLKTRKKRVAD